MESRYESLWLNTSDKTSYPTLQGKQEADVVVVGGGIAGLMTAYLLAQEGKRVSVVEANQIATGTTAYTTAKITILHDTKYAFLGKHFGIDKAKMYADSNQWAIDTIEEILAREQIACHFKRVDGYLYTNEEDKKSEIQQEYEALHRLGISAAYQEHVSGLPFPVAFAVHVPNQAVFHPRQFLLRLAEILIEHDHHIFEHTRITEVKEGDRCEVVCDTGAITANQVVIATNYPIMDKDFLFARLNQWRSYAFAFQTHDQVSEDMFIGIGTHEITVRTYNEKGKRWVIVGGEAHISGDASDTVEKYRRLE